MRWLFSITRVAMVFGGAFALSYYSYRDGRVLVAALIFGIGSLFMGMNLPHRKKSLDVKAILEHQMEVGMSIEYERLFQELKARRDVPRNDPKG